MRRRGSLLVLIGILLASVLPGSAIAASTAPVTRSILEPSLNARMVLAGGIHHVLMRDAVSETTSHYMNDRGNTWTRTRLDGQAGDITTDAAGHVFIATLLRLGNLTPAVRLYDNTSGSLTSEDVTGFGQLCSGNWTLAAVAVGGDGTVHVAWSSIEAKGVCYRARTSSGWGVTQLLNSQVPYVWALDLAVDQENIAHVFVSGVGYPGIGPAECTTGNMVPCSVDIAADDTPSGAFIGAAAGFSLHLVRTPGGAWAASLADDYSVRYLGNSSGSWVVEPVGTGNINDASVAWGPAGPVIHYSIATSGVRRADRGATGWTTTTVTTGPDSTVSGGIDASGRTHVTFTRAIPRPEGWQNATFIVAPDTVAPRVSVPRVTPTRGAVMGATVPVTVSWSGSDSLSGYATSAVQQQTGTTSATVGSGLAGASLRRSLTPGTTPYAFRVRGTDKAGNTSAWSTGPTIKLTRYQEASTTIRYGGTWRTATSSSFSGGAVRYATSTSASATITFTGRGFAWASTYGASRGTARVWVDGVEVAPVSTYRSSSTYRPIAWSISWTSAGTPTIVIRPAGTAGHARIDLDAVVIIR